jgi:TolB protein
VFSPDGTQIIFDSDREKEHSDVFIMNADGSSAPVNLINWENSAQYVLPGCWSPDGAKIVFTSDRNGKGDLYVMSAESFRPKLVLSDATKDLRFPSYSPNGLLVAYQAASENKGAELRIWNSKTQVDSLVVATASAGFAPVWSPGGESIAFQDTIEGQTDICLINPDGSGLKNLTQNPARDGSPAWSPSGKQIAFVSNRDGDYGRLQIYVMNADGSNQHCVYYTKAMSADPCWSPDGKCIVFANDREGDRLGNFEIFSIQPDTSAPERRLTFRRGYDVYPVFSPSGKRIAFVSNADGNPEIYVMNADGTGLLRLTRDPADDITPRWSPDETKLIFSSNRGGKFALYELAVPQ